MSELDLAIAFNDEKFEGLKLAADWIRDLESSDSRIHKEKVIEKALMAANLGSANAQCFLFNCYQAYNPFYVFGVKKVPETEGLEGRPNPWPKFWGMLEALRTRSVTGNSAREAIAEVTSGGVLQVRGAVVENGSRTGKLGDCERKNRELQLHVSSSERTMSYSTIVANTAKSVLYPRCAL